MGCLALPEVSTGVQVVKLDNLCSQQAPEGVQIPEESSSVGCHSEEGTHTSSSRDLVHRISKGLLVPSQQLSSAAARKVQQRGIHSSFYNGQKGTCSSHDRHGTSTTRSTVRIGTFGPPATAGETNSRTPDPVLLKSLPTELLYDDTGLQLFDQITYLPEYYLTAAEIDILSTFGPDIVGQCVADGTSVTELGAGWVQLQQALHSRLPVSFSCRATSQSAYYVQLPHIISSGCTTSTSRLAQCNSWLDPQSCQITHFLQVVFSQRLTLLASIPATIWLYCLP